MSNRRILTPRARNLAFLAVVLAAGAALLTARLGPPGGDDGDRSAPPAPDPQRRDPDARPTDPTALFREDGGTGMMLHPAGAEPLERMPADLPPVEGGEKLIGFRRAGRTWAAEQAVWRIEGADADAVLQRYTEAAKDAGFQLIRESGSKPHGRWFERGRQSLLLRSRPADGGVRLTLIYRYTDASAGDGRRPASPGETDPAR